MGQLPTARTRGIAAVGADDELLGLGGLLFHADGSVWATALITPAGRRYRAAVHRAGLALMDLARELGVARAYAAAQADLAGAEAWLERLGFTKSDLRLTDGRAVFVWERDHHVE